MRLVLLAALLPGPRAEENATVKVLPTAHAASLTKPAADEFTLYLINLSGGDVETRCVVEANRTFDPAETNASARWPAASWNRLEVALGSSVDDLDEAVVFRFNSSNARAPASFLPSSEEERGAGAEGPVGTHSKKY